MTISYGDSFRVQVVNLLRSHIMTFAVCTGLATTCEVGWAFPAAPLPLHKIWSLAESVIYADVVSVSRKTNRASLSVAKVLKTDKEALPETISVFERMIFCPGHHQFQANERVLIFLTFDQEELMYTPAAWSAVFPIEADEFRKFSAFLGKLPAILDEKDPSTQHQRLLAWYFEGAKDSSTRIEGLRGLRWLEVDPEHPNLKLADRQKDDLVRILVAEDPPQESAEELVLFLLSHASDDLDAYLHRSLSHCNDLDWAPVTRLAVQYLPERRSVQLTDDLRQRVDAYFKSEQQQHVEGLDLNPEAQKNFQRSLLVDWGWICCDVSQQCRKK